MTDEVHYEIFCRRQTRAGWSLEGVNAKREDAVRIANDLVARRRAASSRVIKQAYDPKTSDFLSLTIFETGTSNLSLDPKAEDAPAAGTCETPDDLYARPARAVIARLLSDYLARQRLTAGELMHRPDALRQFESTNATFQHAVQRIAVVQSAGGTAPVQEIIKRMNALVIDAMHRVYRDGEQGRFVETAPGSFAKLAAGFACSRDGAYYVNGALAHYLKPAGTWDGKLTRLISILGEAAGEGAALLSNCVDAMIEEILNSSAALAELLCGRDNFNAALHSLTELFLGNEPTGAQPAMTSLAECFAAGHLPGSRTAVAKRILAELKSSKRLCPTSVLEEIKALRRVTLRLTAGVGPDLHPEDLAAALTLRGRRLVTRQALDEAIDGAVNPDEKLERQFFVADNIVGAENKRALAAYLMPFLSGGSFESHFLAARPSPAAALKRLAEHQGRAMRSGFPDEERDDIASLFDRLAVQVETRSGFFKSVEAKTRDGVDKALFYLNLCKGGVTQGRLAVRARKAALSHIGQPDFLARYAAKLKRSPDEAAAQLAALLGSAGIDPAESLARESAAA